MPAPPTATHRGHRAIRTAIALQTLAAFAQAITAGLLLSRPDAGPLHSAGAYTLFFVAVAHLILTVVVWRPGGGPPGPILPAVAFLGLTLAQVALGIAGVRTVHVPLGVLMVALSALQLAGIGSGRRVRPAAAP
ncbi:hypothetical protein Sru01_38900 [Sphaerisporangium rufum]|uniref:Uncharacterized protein n=1 Tax=Sphaerisporangium rufum TaxID=1381558 RepID=A0A919R4F6_9ACTN|nr:hypothetical protein [Sphaerisporangium rufum]GII78908.1 hypothetical protein Sru01_38900 [Sphaerisporangium rufum]